MSDGSDRGRQFLGVGIAFPLAVDPQGRITLIPMAVDAQGRIAMNSYDDHVRQSILLILQTAKGERVMRPDFGAGLRTLVFEPLDAATAALVQHQVTQALMRFEPRIDVLDVRVTAPFDQPGLLEIGLSYRVRHTDTIANLVYPFFIERSGA